MSVAQPSDPADAPSSPAPWRGVHRALADPLRIRLFEALWRGPLSARELADVVGLPPDRIYYHLRQLERSGIIEIGDYRPLPGGKVERVYRRARAEPPGGTSSPQEIAAFLGSVLDATKADITAAFMAKQAGQRREVYAGQGELCLSDEALAELRNKLTALESRLDKPDGGEGTWVRVLFAIVDLEERPAGPEPPGAGVSGGGQ